MVSTSLPSVQIYYFWYLVANYHFPGVIPTPGTIWLHLVKFLSSSKVKNINKGLGLSAYIGNISLIEYFINKGANNWDLGMYKAARQGYKDLVEGFINKGAIDWDWGMVGAARGGHKKLIEFFISKGADHWDSGIVGAALGGHKDLIEFFIRRELIIGIGQCTEQAKAQEARGGHKDLVEYFICKGANSWNSGLSRAAPVGQQLPRRIYRCSRISY